MLPIKWRLGFIPLFSQTATGWISVPINSIEPILPPPQPFLCTEYISSNNINAVNEPSGDTITILAPGNGAQVTDSNDDLHVYITYQSNGGGYQTPTWAYKIDSGFPAYGSPHGGTQVVGSTHRNDILNGQPYGQRQINVVLLDQGGNMHNPPITRSISVNYQSTGGGYQSSGGGYKVWRYHSHSGSGNGSLVTRVMTIYP